MERSEDRPVFAFGRQREKATSAVAGENMMKKLSTPLWLTAPARLTNPSNSREFIHSLLVAYCAGCWPIWRSKTCTYRRYPCFWSPAKSKAMMEEPAFWVNQNSKISFWASRPNFFSFFLFFRRIRSNRVSFRSWLACNASRLVTRPWP